MSGFVSFILKNVLSSYYVSGPHLGAKDSAVNKQTRCVHLRKCGGLTMSSTFIHFFKRKINFQFQFGISAMKKIKQRLD